MFAVMKTGGKQYRVQSGDVLKVEKLAAEAGETVQFNDILMVGATVGTPLVNGAGVQAEVLDQIKGPKTINFVRRRRKHSSKRTKGHRQQLTLLEITEILTSGADKSGVKAAIGAGVVTLMRKLDLAPADLHRVYLAGGFGMHIDTASACGCGLLPGFDPERVEAVGNTSLAGAFMALLDRAILDELKHIGREIEVVELNLDPNFEMNYIDQMSLP